MELVRRTCPEDPIRDKRPYHTDQNHPCCYRNRDTINADDPLWHLESSTKKVGKGNTIGDVRSADHEAHHMRVYEDNICLPTKICRFMPPQKEDESHNPNAQGEPFNQFRPIFLGYSQLEYRYEHLKNGYGGFDGVRDKPRGSTRHRL